MLGLITENDTTFQLEAKADIPIGHKVALKDIKAGDTIWKYGEDVGEAKADVAAGEHLHILRIRTKPSRPARRRAKRRSRQAITESSRSAAGGARMRPLR